MNNKGFTLIELLATLIVLGIVVGITVVGLNINFGKAKEKTEEVFVDTLKDAIDMYLSSEFGSFEMVDPNPKCGNTLSKKHNGAVEVYKYVKNYKNNKGDGISSPITFKDLIDNPYFEYKPLVESEFVNPAKNEGDEDCNVDAVINVYRDEDYIYYYSVDKNALKCLKNIGGEYDSVITNLPEGYSCD